MPMNSATRVSSATDRTDILCITRARCTLIVFSAVPSFRGDLLVQSGPRSRGGRPPSHEAVSDATRREIESVVSRRLRVSWSLVQSASNRVEQRVVFPRLFDEVERARAHCLDACSHTALAAQKDHGLQTAGRDQPPLQLETRDAGKRQVEQHAAGNAPAAARRGMALANRTLRRKNARATDARSRGSTLASSSTTKTVGSAAAGRQIGIATILDVVRRRRRGGARCVSAWVSWRLADASNRCKRTARRGGLPSKWRFSPGVRDRANSPRPRRASRGSSCSATSACLPNLVCRRSYPSDS